MNACKAQLPGGKGKRLKKNPQALLSTYSKEAQDSKYLELGHSAIVGLDLSGDKLTA